MFNRKLLDFEHATTRNCVLDKRSLQDDEEEIIEQFRRDNAAMIQRFNTKKQVLIASLVASFNDPRMDKIDKEIVDTLETVSAFKTRFTDNKRPTSKCVVCLNGVAHYALVPCGHKIACTECIDKLIDKPCPTCRMVADGSIRIFD